MPSSYYNEENWQSGLTLLQFFLATPQYIALVAVIIGTFSDLRSRIIPNWLTFGTALAGLVFNAMSGNIMQSLLGLFVGLALVTLPNILQKKTFMAGGDAKLWAALGACLLVKQMLVCFFYFSLAYGLVSTVIMLRKKGSGKTFVPLCPMIAVGTFLGVFFEQPLLNLLGFK